jgi:hypothetical protein
VLLLRVGAVLHDDRPDLRDALVGGARYAVALHLLEEDHHFSGFESHAAPFPRPVGGDPAFVAQRVPPVPDFRHAHAARQEAKRFGIPAFDERADLGAEVCVRKGVVVSVHLACVRGWLCHVLPPNDSSA